MTQKGYKHGIVPRDYIRTLPAVSRARYLHKIAIGGLSGTQEIDPYQVTGDSNHPLPKVAPMDIHSFLVERVSFCTGTEMKAYKQMKAYEYLVAGNIELPLHSFKLPAPDIVLVRAKVHRSQGDRNMPHHSWIMANEEGTIEAGHCTCMAGLGEACAHTAAILFAVEIIVRKEEENLSCTSTANWWLPPSQKDIIIAELRKLDFDSTETKRKKLDGKSVRSQRSDRIYKSTIPEVSAQEFRASLTKLSAIQPQAAILVTTMEFGVPYAEHFELESRQQEPPSLAEMFEERFCNLTLVELQDAAFQAFEAFILSAEQIQYIFNETKSQHKSSLWKKYRVGRVTASIAGRVNSTTISETPAITYVKSICFPASCKSSKAAALVYGRDSEPLALEDYTARQRVRHPTFKVLPCGLKIKQDQQYVAATPDALGHCDCCGYCIVEIKCPHVLRDAQSIKEFVGKKTCYLSFSGENVALNEKHDYFHQVQYQLAVFEEALFCDFVVWTKCDFVVQRIYPNASVQSALLAKAEEYFFKVSAPQLMAKYFTGQQGGVREPLQVINK